MANLEIRNDNRKAIMNKFDELMANALTQCGLVAEGHAKMNLTKQHAVDTGALRNSITYKVTKESGGQVCYVGTNMEYAPYIEFGTGKYVSGGRRTSWLFKDSKGNWHRTEGQKPRPYLKPAVTEHTKEYEQVIQNTVKM